MRIHSMPSVLALLDTHPPAGEGKNTPPSHLSPGYLYCSSDSPGPHPQGQLFPPALPGRDWCS